MKLLIEYKKIYVKNLRENRHLAKFVAMRIDGIVNRNHIGRGWVF